MNSVISSGLIITDKKYENILLVHPTHGKYWSIPKGIMETFESPFETMKRELKEETDIDFDNLPKIDELIDYGIHSYLKEKHLYIFVQSVDLPEFFKHFYWTLKCTSMVTNCGAPFPENDDFVISSIRNLKSILPPKLFNVIKSLDCFKGE